jgi:hypothetical protein
MTLHDEDGKWIGHIAGRTSPEGEQRAAPDRACPDCGKPLEPEYGFCKFGLGVFDRCMGCGEVFNFHEDRE